MVQPQPPAVIESTRARGALQTNLMSTPAPPEGILRISRRSPSAGLGRTTHDVFPRSTRSPPANGTAWGVCGTAMRIYGRISASTTHWEPGAGGRPPQPVFASDRRHRDACALVRAASWSNDAARRYVRLFAEVVVAGGWCGRHQTSGNFPLRSPIRRLICWSRDAGSHFSASRTSAPWPTSP